MTKRYHLFLFSTIFTVVLSSGMINAQETVTDIDGNEYTTVTIGDLVWMAENLRTDRFSNGDTIPLANAYADWNTISHTNAGPAKASFRESSFFSDTFGYLYNHYVLTDPRGITPEGWRVPTEADWQALETFLGMPEADLERGDGWAGADSAVAAKLRSTSTDFWETSENSTATDEFGFSWIAGSVRYSDGTFESEISAYRFGALWSLDEDASDATKAWRRLARYDRDDLRRSPVPKGTGHHIRLVRDATITNNEVGPEEPKEFALSQNYPNPFNPSTLINYVVPEISNVKITIYDILGREVAVLVNETKTAGSYHVNFDATGLSSGVYMYRLQTGDVTLTKLMTLLK